MIIAANPFSALDYNDPLIPYLKTMEARKYLGKPTPFVKATKSRGPTKAQKKEKAKVAAKSRRTNR